MRSCAFLQFDIFFTRIIIMNYEINILKKMLKENIENYNDELFELDNEIKRIHSRIEIYKKKIYDPILKSNEYKTFSKNIDNQKKYNFLVNCKNKMFAMLMTFFQEYSKKIY